jgi:hypothetical protein
MGSYGGMRYGSGGGGGTATAAGVGGGTTAAGVAGMGTLTKEERHAVYEYTGSDATTLNRFLREGRVAPDIMTRAAMKAETTQLDSAVGKGTLTRETTLYRGTSLATFGLMGAPKVGQVIRDKGFLSASTSQDVGHEGSFRGGLKLTVIAPRGTRGVDASHVAGGGEKEIVLGRGQRLQVTSVRSANTGRDFIGQPAIEHHVTARIVR